MMLGFIVTRSVLVPTSAEYFSLMGGTLHLKTKSAESISFPHLLFLMIPPFPMTAHLLNWDLENGISSGNILKISVVIGRMPLVSTSYLSLDPAGVFLLVVNKKDGALQQRDKDILKLPVSSLFCSHLQTCKFRHLSNRSEVLTIVKTLTSIISCLSSLQAVELNSKEPS